MSENMNIKKIIFILLFIITGYTSFSQNILKGRVVDAIEKKPLQGATVLMGGKMIITDNNGLFSLPYKKLAKISVSYVGYNLLEQFIQRGTDFLELGLTPLNPYLNTVEVTSTSSQNKSLLYQPASISKLTQLELKRGTGLYLDDAINTNVPGVSMERRTVSAGQQFNIRGYGNGSRGTRGISSNFDGQGYKVYLNDIPVTDAEGITVMDDIDFSSLGNVEIVKGPAGTLYGMAIAGAVNLTSIKPEPGETVAGQDVVIGSYGLQRYTTHFSTSGERSSLLINYGYQLSDGYMQHTASNKTFANFVGSFQPNAKETINMYLGYSKSYDERGGELTIAQYNSKDYSGNVEYIKRNGHSAITSVRAGISDTYLFTNNISNTTSLFGTGLNSNASSAGGWTDKAPINFGLRSVFSTKIPLSNTISLSGSTGIETQKQLANTMGYNMKQSPMDTTTRMELRKTLLGDQCAYL
jgi:iron complex outermembrane receptor protein